MTSEEEKQCRRDAEYRQAWADLTPEQKARLAAAGLDGPDCDRESAPDRGRREVVGREHDVAETSDRVGGLSVDFAAAVDTLADTLAEDFGVTSEQAVRLAAFMGKRLHDETTAQSALLLGRIVGYFLLGSDNLRARAHGLAHAARMSSRNGLRSLRHSAEVCGVSPEWMRRVAWKWCETLDLPPLEGAKTAAAKAAYSLDKKTNHYRNKKCTLQSLQKPPPSEIRIKPSKACNSPSRRASP